MRVSCEDDDMGISGGGGGGGRAVSGRCGGGGGGGGRVIRACLMMPLLCGSLGGQTCLSWCETRGVWHVENRGGGAWHS